MGRPAGPGSDRRHLLGLDLQAAFLIFRLRALGEGGSRPEALGEFVACGPSARGGLSTTGRRRKLVAAQAQKQQRADQAYARLSQQGAGGRSAQAGEWPPAVGDDPSNVYVPVSLPFLPSDGESSEDDEDDDEVAQSSAVSQGPKPRGSGTVASTAS